MINKLLVFSLCIVINTGLFSQNNATGLEGKRINVEAGVGFSLFPSYMSFDLNNLQDLISLRYNFEVGYTLSNKFKASLYYTNTKVNIDSVNTYEDNYYQSAYNYLEYDGYNNFKNTKVNGYGLKVNYFLHGFIAPVGGSIGLSFKKTFINTPNHVWTEARESLNDRGDRIVTIVRDSAELKMNYTTIGFHYENMLFLSSKVPLYIKYGISTALRIGKSAKRGGIEVSLDKQTDSYDDEIINIYRDFLNKNYRHDIFEFNFSIGIII